LPLTRLAPSALATLSPQVRGEGKDRVIERFFSKLKHFRRVATRYDKLAVNFLAMVQLASMRLWMRANEPTG